MDAPAIVIDSTAALPEPIREVMLDLDRKYREIEYRQAEDPNWVPAEETSRLTRDQVRAFGLVADFYDRNQLPPLST